MQSFINIKIWLEYLQFIFELNFKKIYLYCLINHTGMKSYHENTLHVHVLKWWTNTKFIYYKNLAFLTISQFLHKKNEQIQILLTVVSLVLYKQMHNVHVYNTVYMYVTINNSWLPFLFYTLYKRYTLNSKIANIVSTLTWYFKRLFYNRLSQEIPRFIQNYWKQCKESHN